jgi:hypothetical protein
MCCKSKFIITEEDKNHILDLYGLLNEQVVSNNTESNQTKTFTQKTKLLAGIWSEPRVKPAFEPFFAELTKYLNDNKGKTYITTIKLVGSESKIPNTDNENNRQPLEPKVLSIRRLQSIKKIIGDTFKKFREDGTLINEPKFSEQTLEGTTEWVGQTFGSYKCEEKEARNKCRTEFEKCKTTTCQEVAKKYQDDQYVEITIDLTEVPAKCLYNAKIMVYTMGQAESPPHKCNNAKYAVYLNDVLLKNDYQQLPPYSGDGSVAGTIYYASMDNEGGGHDFFKDQKIKIGAPRNNIFTITPELAKEILLKGKNKNELVLSLSCLKGTEFPHKISKKDCHADAVHFKYIPGSDTKGKSFEGSTKGITDDQVKKIVSTFKVCGG